MAHLEDFPPGPLDRYRKRASFDWKKLKIYLNDEDMIVYENEMYEDLMKNPVFERPLLTPTFDETRHLATKKMHIMKATSGLSPRNLLGDVRVPLHAVRVLYNFDASSATKLSVSVGMFISVLQSLGTSRHAELIMSAIKGEIIGCFCLTEIGHGTDTKSMRTTATYDRETQEFVINSPDFEAAKCWAGGLGQSATHAIVFAQLITSDGVQHGLHSFVIQIRCTKTLKPLPGVKVGDMGEKIGLNGIDNGFVMFDQYRVPHTALLNKTGNVTEDGQYVTPFRDPNKRHGASLGALSAGRVSITNLCGVYAGKGITIAIRYAAVRKQFGPKDGEELPILEYQTHQHRLLPYLAATYAINIFSNFLVVAQYQFTYDTLAGNNTDLLPDIGMELHVISSASKPVSGWTSRDALQECREACGGHGYLKASGIGDVRNDNDANCTYEGENHVLIQQTSNWLLKLWPVILEGGKVSSPFKSVDFLTNAKQILKTKFSAKSVEEVVRPEYVLDMYKWLVSYLLKVSHDKYENNVKNGIDPFWAKNDNQVYYARSLAVAYIQHFMLQKMLDCVNGAPDESIRNVLANLLSLYGLWTLEKHHLVTLYQGGYTVGNLPASLIQDAVLMLCKLIKNDAVALVDVIAPPDFVLGSVLGASDGLVYKHLYTAMMSSPHAVARPSWWNDIINWQSHVQSKL